MIETAYRPAIVLIDDDQNFLSTTRIQARINGDSLVVHGLCIEPSSEEPAVVAALQTLMKKQRIDAILLDKNIPGIDGESLIKRITDMPEAAYVPLLVMTAHLDEVTAPEETLEKGVLGYLPKYPLQSRQPAGIINEFLRQIRVSLPQWRGQIEDEVWTTVTQRVAEQLSERRILTDIVNGVEEFLTTHFDICAFYVRILTGNNSLQRVGKNDYFEAGVNITPEHVPYLKEVMKADARMPPRRESLSKSDVGLIERLIAHRALAAPLAVNGQSFGTMTLYRSPDRPPFRRKDEIFVKHLGLLIAGALAAEQERSRVRARQTRLSEFLKAVFECRTQTEIADNFVEYLHQEVHDGDNDRCKVTLRVLRPGDGNIERIAHRGQSTKDHATWPVDKDGSIYSRVIMHGRTECYHDLRTDPPKNGWVETCNGTRSGLTVPLLASGSCLGAVNLESLGPNHYSDNDRALVEALAQIVGAAMVAIKTQSFIAGLFDLLNGFTGAPRLASVEETVAKASGLLHDFSGYARLLYLTPDPNGGVLAPWIVKRLLGPGGRPLADDDIRRWQVNINDNWDKTFLYRSLRDTAHLYTNDHDEFHNDGLLGINTKAIHVIHLRHGNGHSIGSELSGILEMHFLLPRPLSEDQRDTLDQFGQFIGWLIDIGRDVRQLLNERTVARQQVEMGNILGAFRHRLRTGVGLIASVAAVLRYRKVDEAWLDTIERALEDITTEIENSKFLVKFVEPTDVDIVSALRTLVTDSDALARRKNVRVLAENWPDKLMWHTDATVLRVVIENLIQNAIAACEADGGDVCVHLGATDETLTISVVDTGPGISESIRDKLFCLGVTTRPHGTGFGLYSARLRAIDLGGELIYDSAVHPGACFRLVLLRSVEGCDHG